MKSNESDVGGFSRITDASTLSFPEFWAKLYQENENRYPAILINSKSTSFYAGFTSPFYDLNELGSAIDIVHLKEKCDDGYEIKAPSFYDAVSPTNRFPVVSPAAKLDGKGYFVDGGYYENSGLLTTRNFLDSLFTDVSECDSVLHRIKNIVIHNGKNAYIRHLWDTELKDKFEVDYGSVLTKLNESAEFSSILGAVSDTEGLPYALELEFRRNKNLYPIYLPHEVSLTDVKELFRGNIINEIALDEYLRRHNKELRDALRHNDGKYDLEKWGVVEPPLSRLLSEPGYEYQRSMLLFHPRVRQMIDAI